MGCSASRPLTLLTKTPEQISQPSPTTPTTSTTNSSSSSSLYSNSSPPLPVPAPVALPRAVSISAPLVHHPPLRKGDTHHLVSLTSTTYGSLHIDPTSPNTFNLNGQDSPDQTHKISLSSPDSVINTWELMDGLNDSDFHSHFPPKQPISSNYDHPIGFPSKSSSCRYSSFNGSVKKQLESFKSVKSPGLKAEDSMPPSSSFSSSSSKPLWQHLSEESLLSKMDPNVVLTYRRALSSRQLGYNNAKAVRSLTHSNSLYSSISNACFRLPGAQDKIVIYFTSLRGIRKTYEDCCAVRMIFRGFRVAVDERDISMDSEYRKELHKAVGGKSVSLPQVFVRGKHVGGAEEVKQLNEAGELGKLLRGFPVRDGGFACEGCGDARFAPCPTCNGSRKLFDEDYGELRRCQDCNENGLIRCPGCCL